MKMKYLALAIMSVVSTTALTACGGSDGDGSTTFTPPGTPTGTTPTGTTVVDSVPQNTNIETIPLDNKATVVGQQYIRNPNSKFDYTYNTKAENDGSNTALGSLSLNTQNPELTNLVLARESQTVTVNGTNQNVDVIRYAGNLPGEADTLQKENVKNVVISDGSVTDKSGLVKTSVTSGSFQNVVNTLYSEDDLNNTSTTRIFGKNYADESALGVAETAPNSYAYSLKNANGSDVTLAKVADGNIKATPITLQNVQYGRVSNNIDPLVAGAVNPTGSRYVGTDFVARNAPDAVNMYFYRGTNETALTDMPTAGVYQYQGHALTYGLDNTAGKGAVVDTPNSFGVSTTATTVGSFVAAEYDAAKKSVNGQIYNVSTRDNTLQTPTVVPLVTFGGEVHGNSVLGTSTNLTTSLKEDREGNFKASFYGSKAAELGGAVNNITSGYGDAKWGAVFGAQKIVAPVAPTTPTTPAAPGNGFEVDVSVNTPAK